MKMMKSMKSMKSKKTSGSKSKTTNSGMYNTFNAEMQSMMKKPAKPQKTVDKNYAAQMLVHHPASDKMSKTELKKGKSPAMRTIAKQILKNQAPQERSMRNYLKQTKK